MEIFKSILILVLFCIWSISGYIYTDGNGANLIHTTSSYFTQNIYVTGSLSVNSTISSLGAISGPSLSISGSSNLGSVSVSSLTATSTINTPTLTVSSISTGGSSSLQITPSVSTSSVATNTLTSAGTITVSAPLSTGTITGTSITGSTLTSSGSVVTNVISSRSTGAVGVPNFFNVGGSLGSLGQFNFLSTYHANGTGTPFTNHWWGYLPGTASNNPIGKNLIHVAGVPDSDNVRRLGLWDEVYVRGNLFVSGGITYQGSLTNAAPSDKRIKEDIKPLDTSKSLKKIASLQMKEFKFKKDWDKEQAGKVQHGFIAQEVQEIFPQAVENLPRQYKNETVLGIKENILFTEAIAAIQALNQEIQLLKKEIKNLKKEMKNMKRPFQEDDD